MKQYVRTGVETDHQADRGTIPRLAGDDFGAGGGFVFGLVRQHGAFAAIADGIDARHIGAIVVIGDDPAALVEQNVLRLDVPVDVVLHVQGDQGQDQLSGPLQREVSRNRTLGEVLLKSATFI